MVSDGYVIKGFAGGYLQGLGLRRGYVLPAMRREKNLFTTLINVNEPNASFSGGPKQTQALTQKSETIPGSGQYRER